MDSPDLQCGVWGFENESEAGLVSSLLRYCVAVGGTLVVLGVMGVCVSGTKPATAPSGSVGSTVSLARSRALSTDEMAASGTATRFLKAVANEDRAALSQLLAPSIPASFIDELLGSNADWALADTAGVGRVIVIGDFALVVSQPFQTPQHLRVTLPADIKPPAGFRSWDDVVKSGVAVIRLKKHLDRWVVDKPDGTPSALADKEIERFEDFARRRSGVSDAGSTVSQ